MAVADVAASHQERQTLTARTASAAVLARWRQVDPDDIVSSWSQQVPQVAGQVAAAQATAARRGADYVPQIIREQGAVPDPVSQVNVSRLVGVASDGRPLDTLLALPSVQTVNRIGRGTPPDAALRHGGRMLRMLAETQVLDAGRVGAAVGMVADQTVSGYRRQLRGDTNCARCIILAGKWFRWNQGFQRHPQCDCVHVPAVGPKADLDGVAGFDPNAYFETLPVEQQDRVFGRAGAESIRSGADMGQVVNARRGMRSTRAYGRTIKTTHIGTSTRASAARQMARDLDVQFSRQGGRYRQVNVPRLMPEQIFADATSRDDAIRLLGRFGYL